MKSRVFGIFIIPFFAVSCGKSMNSEKSSDLSSSNLIVNYAYEVNNQHVAREQNERVSSLIFHYTAIPTLNGSLRALTGSIPVSSHWLVPVDGNTIYKLVDENKRAYHAGLSFWKKRSDINDTSIGIEIVSSGFICKDGRSSNNCPKELKEWAPYPDSQQDLIVELAQDIKNRYNIDPLCVVGHSDIAPGRKFDPGPLFPWKKLAENGVGAWANENEIQNEVQNVNSIIQREISKLVVQTRLYEFGYNIKKSTVSDKFVLDKLISYGYNTRIKFSDLSALNNLNEYANNNTSINEIFDDSLTDSAIDAFLMHYLPDVYLKNETPDNLKLLATLQALLIKYPNRAKAACGF